MIPETSVAHAARRYKYWLGGKDNFAADRESGDQIAALFPTVRLAVLENRGFLKRAVALLTGEFGVRQFLDVGTGLPSADNTHEVAQRIAPGAKVVYVDNDPLVMVHARALLTSAPGGVTDYLECDLRKPEQVLAGARKTLDFDRPVALMMVAVMHFVGPGDDPHGLVRTYLDALPDGSFLVMSHPASDWLDPGWMNAADQPFDGYPRSHDEVTRFFDGLEMVPPGLVSLVDWRREETGTPAPQPHEVSGHCGIGRVSRA